MERVARFKVWKGGKEIGEFLHFRRIGLTLFRDPSGNLRKPKLSFEELYKLYRKAGYEITENFDSVDRLLLDGRIVLRG